MTIRTSRLDLVPVEPSDAQAVLRDERGADWAIDYPTEGDVVIAGLVAQSSVARADAYVPYKIALRASGLVIGGCGFLGPPDATGAVEIGYGLVPTQRGKGIATEAVNGLLDAAWRDTAVRIVVAFTDRDNEASQGVLRRVGRWEIEKPNNEG